jgi:hypothetical protein
VAEGVASLAALDVFETTSPEGGQSQGQNGCSHMFAYFDLQGNTSHPTPPLKMSPPGDLQFGPLITPLREQLSDITKWPWKPGMCTTTASFFFFAILNEEIWQ